jgi:hypothetical protein
LVTRGILWGGPWRSSTAFSTSSISGCTRTGLGLVDELDRAPDVPGQHRHAVDHHFVALAAEWGDATVRAAARARLARHAHEVIRAVTDQRRDLVDERRAHQLTALAVAHGVGALGIERLDERAVLPEVAAVVLLALGRGADVAEARLDEQLEAPALDALTGAWPDRLPGEDHALVAGERVDRVDVAGLQRVLDHHEQRPRHRVPAGGPQLA